jgi:hypothetical protein
VLAVGTELGEQLHDGTGRHWQAGPQDRTWIYIERALASGRPAVVQIPINGEISSLEVPSFEEFATWYDGFLGTVCSLRRLPRAALATG